MIKGSSGIAVTSTRIEYHYHKESTFEVTVLYLSLHETKEHLERLLIAYRDFNLHQDEMDRDALRDFQNQSDLAEDTFISIFGSSFWSAQKVHLTPSSIEGQQQPNVAVSGASQDLIHLVLSRMMAAVQRSGFTGMSRLDTYQHAAQCAEHLQQINSTTPGATSIAEWPLIKKIV